MMKMILKDNFKEIIYKANHLFVKQVDLHKSDLILKQGYISTCFINAYRVVFNITIPQV